MNSKRLEEDFATVNPPRKRLKSAKCKGYLLYFTVGEKLLLTQYFYEEVQKLGFIVGPTPELSVCIFRWIPQVGDANEFNRKLVQYLQQGGEIFLSSTSIDGVFWPRICIMVFRTHLEHVDKLLKLLGEFVKTNLNESDS